MRLRSYFKYSVDVIFLMSRRYKCLALISLFQSLVSWFIVSGVILAPIDVIFLWLEYDRIIAESDDPNVTAIHVSLNSRLFCLARVSRIIAMTCHVHVSLVSIFFYGLNLAHVWPRFSVRVGSAYHYIQLDLANLNSLKFWIPHYFEITISLGFDLQSLTIGYFQLPLLRTIFRSLRVWNSRVQVKNFNMSAFLFWHPLSFYIRTCFMYQAEY